MGMSYGITLKDSVAAYCVNKHLEFMEVEEKLQSFFEELDPESALVIGLARRKVEEASKTLNDVSRVLYNEE